MFILFLQCEETWYSVSRSNLEERTTCHKEKIMFPSFGPFSFGLYWSEYHHVVPFSFIRGVKCSNRQICNIQKGMSQICGNQQSVCLIFMQKIFLMRQNNCFIFMRPNVQICGNQQSARDPVCDTFHCESAATWLSGWSLVLVISPPGTITHQIYKTKHHRVRLYKTRPK